MSKKYLDSTGLSYFWGKLKSYFQKKLVSGTNIKTINGQSVLGSGNITVSGGGVEEIFFAEYGETTYQEVEEVYIDGRVIIMKNGPILAQLAQHDEGYEFIFVAYEGEGYYAVYTLDPVEDWNYEGYIIPTSLADLSSDSTHRVVTDTEKATWNGKSNFSGNYNDLTNKPTIPTNTSDLVNDSGFLTSESIFIAEKDVTTYAEITAALNAGKTVFAKTSNSYNTFNLYTYAFDNGTFYYFYRQHGGAQVNMLNVDNTDTWSSGSTSLVTTDKPIVHEHFTLPSRNFPANAAYWFASNNIAVPTKTGYTAVGIVGVSSNSNYILVNPIINDSDPTKLYGFARNLHTSAVSTTIEFDVLYVRTDLL